jgi:hypothetical protein
MPEVVIMPGYSRAARLSRLLAGRNALRRSSDRAEGVIVLLLTAVFITAVAGAALLGVKIYQSQRAASAHLRPAVAVLTQSGPVADLSAPAPTRARWRAPDGRERTGVLTPLIAPAIWDAAAGTRVRVWVTTAGDLAAPPLNQGVVICDAVLGAFWAIGGSAAVLILCYWLCRRGLDRRRLRAWESAWALTGPRWTSRR